MNSLSTLEEIIKRKNHPDFPGIHSIEDSVIREGVKIVVFNSGDQANIDSEVYNKLEKIKK